MNEVTFESALQGRVEEMVDACTRCGKCVAACPSVKPAGIGDADPVATVSGVIDLLRGGDGSEAGRKWASSCVMSGACIPACDDGVNPRFLLSMARIAAAKSAQELPTKRAAPSPARCSATSRCRSAARQGAEAGFQRSSSSAWGSLPLIRVEILEGLGVSSLASRGNCGPNLAMAAAMETTAMKSAAVEATSTEAAAEIVAVEMTEAAAETKADGRGEERAAVVVIGGRVVGVAIARRIVITGRAGRVNLRGSGDRARSESQHDCARDGQRNRQILAAFHGSTPLQPLRRTASRSDSDLRIRNVPFEDRGVPCRRFNFCASLFVDELLVSKRPSVAGRRSKVIVSKSSIRPRDAGT
ncbi:MAG TPA: (Fe-S)-binding protein [Stellaceae bacterium]|nr:(Fe-S)-binding protein [Stellaceae bacterium]